MTSERIIWAIAIVLSFFVGAYAHELDIQSSCEEEGVAEHSAWLGDLRCSPINRD